MLKHEDLFFVWRFQLTEVFEKTQSGSEKISKPESPIHHCNFLTEALDIWKARYVAFKNIYVFGIQSDSKFGSRISG